MAQVNFKLKTDTVLSCATRIALKAILCVDSDCCSFKFQIEDQQHFILNHERLKKMNCST